MPAGIRSKQFIRPKAMFIKPTTQVEYRRRRKIQKNCEKAIKLKTKMDTMSITLRFAAASSSVGLTSASNTNRAKKA